MKVCLIRGSGVEQHEVDDVFHAMEARQVEGVELKRDADAATTAELLKGTDLILTLGGDGTFLAGARVAAPREISILGVNHGHLGFLTEIEAEHMQVGLHRFLDGSYRIEERTMLQVTLARKGHTMVQEIGLNEVVVDHAGESRILRMEIDVGGQRVGVIDADGAIVATASGSTAYALAGSGKSLIVDSLSLALGARASTDQVRHGAERAIVEAAFDSVVLVREVGKRSAARIDGRAATPGQLRELGDRLVALHGQHEHHALLDPDTQTELLDAYGGALELRAGASVAHAAYLTAANALRDLEQLRSRGKREQEYLRWRLDELRQADPQPGEDDALAAERAAMRHAARLADLGQQAMDALHEDGLARAAAAMSSAAAFDGRLADQAARLDALAGELSDVAAGVRRYVELLDSNPVRLEAIESRRSVLEAIKSKHGGSIESVVLERLRVGD